MTNRISIDAIGVFAVRLGRRRSWTAPFKIPRHDGELSDERNVLVRRVFCFRQRGGAQPKTLHPDRCVLKKSGAGFTLLEVLLATVAFSFVLLAIHYVLHGALQLRNKTTRALEAAVPQQHALAIMRRDLANIVMPNGVLSGQLQTTPTNNTRTTSLVGGQPVGPDFYTAAAIVDEYLPWTDLCKVTYRLAPPTNNAFGLDLYRSVTRNLLPTLDEQPEEQWLLSGVERLDFQFYDGTQWRTTWDSSVEESKLPRAVKVELQLAQESFERIRPVPIELVVPVTVQARTNEVAAAEGGGP